MNKLIYVASASAEPYLSQTEASIKILIGHGWTVTHDWTKDVRKAGHGSPLDANLRKECALRDLEAVLASEVIWLRQPDEHAHRVPPYVMTTGAWSELGAALMLNHVKHEKAPKIVVSGESRHSIFADLAHLRFKAHDDALSFLLTPGLAFP